MNNVPPALTSLTAPPDGALDVTHMVSRRRARLPAGYVAEHVTLGYATTIQRVNPITATIAIIAATLLVPRDEFVPKRSGRLTRDSRGTFGRVTG